MGSEKVEAGKLLDSLQNSLKDTISSLFQDEETVKGKSGQTIGYKFSILLGDEEDPSEIHAKVLVSDKSKNLFDVYLVGDNRQKAKKSGVSKQQVDDFIESQASKWYPDKAVDTYVQDKYTQDINTNDKEFKEAEASKKLQVTLSKVEGSEEIVLGPIYCNYDALDVYDDLEDTLENDDILDIITLDPQVYEVEFLPEGTSLSQIESIQSMDYVSEIIKSQLTTLCKLYVAAKDVSLLDRDPWYYINTIRWQLDWLLQSKLSASVDMKALAQNLNLNDNIYERLDVSNIVEEYACVLDLYYANFDHEVQKLLDEWLLTLRYDIVC